MRVIRSATEKLIESSNEVLAEAIENGFEAVIIFGWKDGQLYIKNSHLKDRLTVIGAMEEIKHHLITNTV